MPTPHASARTGLAENDVDFPQVPTSLLDLGYSDVGLDDNWQSCGDYDGYTYHDETGAPVVNTTRFPDMKEMTDRAHSLGLTAGWYGPQLRCPKLAASSPRPSRRRR